MNAWPEQPLAVTVGAGAMGMAIARRVGQEHRLLLVDVNSQRLQQQVALLNDEGINAEGFACDITSSEEVRLLADTVKSIGHLKALVHVAALSPSMADWRKVMSVNLIGAARVFDAFGALAQPNTAAVAISSMSAHLGNVDLNVAQLLSTPLASDFLDRLETHFGEAMTPALSYMLSKYQLNRLVESLSVRWGEKGARIVSVSPGLIATPMGKLEFENNPGKHRLLQQTPLQRQGSMQEIADAVEFLISPRASFISGVDILVDGGTAAALKHSQDNVSGGS